MKYSEKTFNKEADYYKERLKGKVEGKVVFIESNIKNIESFLSIAPLSRAVHDLGGDMHVSFIDKIKSNALILKDVWAVYRDYKKRLKTKKVKALLGFINAVNKRTRTKVFKDIFIEPEITLKAGKNCFRGTIDLNYKYRWHRRYKSKELFETAKRIWREGYNLSKNEQVSIGFVLVPPKEKTELPLEDYLDSFSIAFSMMEAAKSLKADVSMGSSTDRFSIMAKAVRTVDLATTLRGCEYDKEVDEEVFIKFREFSKLLRIHRFRNPSASFGIHAKGYYGKHFFGEMIGYPTLDKKTRWSSPGQIMLKDRYSPQTVFEKRDPIMRYAITESLPIDVFVETCNINYEKLRKRSEKVRDILNKCEYVRVIGEVIAGYKTDFRADLLTKEGKRREFTAQDSDVRTIIDQSYFKKTGIKAGTFANFPSGESFVTPEKVRGIMVGDVVINIDRSYILNEKKPLIVEFENGNYKIVKGPSDLLEIVKKERKEAKQKIRDYEKNKSLPKEIIKIYQENFLSVGEFAINTNPKAKLSNYLIVNEKIANMIHVALGSGFEPDKKTIYHWDIVVNSPRQKLDIYGVDDKKRVHWIHKKGRLVV